MEDNLEGLLNRVSKKIADRGVDPRNFKGDHVELRQKARDLGCDVLPYYDEKAYFISTYANGFETAEITLDLNENDPRRNRIILTVGNEDNGLHHDECDFCLESGGSLTLLSGSGKFDLSDEEVETLEKIFDNLIRVVSELFND